MRDIPADLATVRKLLQDAIPSTAQAQPAPVRAQPAAVPPATAASGSIAQLASQSPALLNADCFLVFFLVTS
eukprot:m.282335 g.282335  ORF g.282335 m.282335 type:complete len:72 (-) comp54939_c1_seq6:312-527(-)